MTYPPSNGSRDTTAYPVKPVVTKSSRPRVPFWNEHPLFPCVISCRFLLLSVFCRFREIPRSTTMCFSDLFSCCPIMLILIFLHCFNGTACHIATVFPTLQVHINDAYLIWNNCFPIFFYSLSHLPTHPLLLSWAIYVFGPNREPAHITCAHISRRDLYLIIDFKASAIPVPSFRLLLLLPVSFMVWRFSYFFTHLLPHRPSVLLYFLFTWITFCLSAFIIDRVSWQDFWCPVSTMRYTP